MTSQPGKQIIAIHILSNISRNKGNQTMILGQSIEYNMRNIFLKKSFTKCRGETIARSFSKTSKLSISLDRSSKVVWSLCFIVYQVREKSKEKSKLAKLRYITLNYLSHYIMITYFFVSIYMVLLGSFVT